MNDVCNFLISRYGIKMIHILSCKKNDSVSVSAVEKTSKVRCLNFNQPISAPTALVLGTTGLRNAFKWTFKDATYPSRAVG